MHQITVQYIDITLSILSEDDNPLALDNLSRVAKTTLVDMVEELELLNQALAEGSAQAVTHREAFHRDYLLTEGGDDIDMSPIRGE